MDNEAAVGDEVSDRPASDGKVLACHCNRGQWKSDSDLTELAWAAAIHRFRGSIVDSILAYHADGLGSVHNRGDPCRV